MNIQTRLSPRLKMILQLVPDSKTVCDIGTDHGYAAIYLVQSGKAQRVIATDIKKGPLRQAEKNIAESGEIGKIELRLSDGFSNIGEGEAETAVIAGMGGETIIEILKCERKIKSFVLQPQSAHMKLRKFLYENGYIIKDESLCREGKKMYAAILAERGSAAEESSSELEIGPVLIKKHHPLLADYIDYRLHEVLTALEKLSETESAEDRKAEYNYLKTEYERIKREYYENADNNKLS